MKTKISLYDWLRIAYTAFVCPVYTLSAYAYFNEQVKRQDAEDRIIAQLTDEVPDGKKN